MPIDPNGGTPPAVMQWNGSGAGTSGAFDVPAGAYVVVMCGVDDNAGNASWTSVKDNVGAGNTYAKHRATTGPGASAVFGFYYAAAQTGVILTVTPSGGWPFATSANAWVRICTGAAQTQPGNVGGSNGPTASLAASAVGSYIFGAFAQDNSAAGVTGAANTTLIGSQSSGGGNFVNAAFMSSAATADTAAHTYGVSGPNGGACSLVEIVPATGGAAQTCSPTAIVSGEAEGAPAVSAKVTSSPSGVGSAQAFGAPALTVINPVRTLQPAAIASVEAFGVPSLAAPLTVAVVGIAEYFLEGYGQPRLTTATPLGPVSIASAQALGNPAIGEAVVSSPQGITSAEVHGSPLLSSMVVLSPSGVVSAEGSGSPVLDFRLTLAALGIASAEGIGVPALSTRVQSAPLGVPSAEALGVPSLAAQMYATTVGIASAQAMGTPGLTTRVLLSPLPIMSGEALGLPRVGGFLTVSPVAIASAQTLGSPALYVYLPVSPQSLASGEAFGALTLSTLVSLMVGAIASGEAVGLVWVSYGVIKPAHRPHGAVLPAGSGVILWSGRTRGGSITSAGGSGSIE